MIVATTIASAVLTYAATHLRVLDLPNHRSSHARPIPRLGGVAIVAAFALGLVGVRIAGFDTIFVNPGISVFMAASVVVATIGLADDIWQGPVWTKFIGQVIGTAILLGSGVVLERLTVPWLGPIDLGIAGYFVTALWLIGFTNAFNFMDGLNGIAGGTATIAAFAFGFLAYGQGADDVGTIALILAGATLGFLPFNFPNARIFMGDVGSQFLGFSLAGLAILGAASDGPRISFLVMPILFLGFIWDVSFTIGRRLMAGEPIWRSHRTHLYQLLSRSLGSAHVRVSFLHFGMAGLQVLAAWYLLMGHTLNVSIAVGGLVVILALYTLIVMHCAKATGVDIRSAE